MHELQISLQGQPSTLDGLTGTLVGGGKAFIQKICSSLPLTISRRDQGQIIQEVNDLISKANQNSFTQPDAKQAIVGLQSFCSDQGLQPELCESASQAAINLSNALSLAEAYDKVANEIVEKLNNERDLNEIIGLQSKIASLPRLGNVNQTAPLPFQLNQEWRSCLDHLVEGECHKLENIQRTTQIELNQKQLDGLKKQLKKSKLAELVKRVDTALDVIAAKSDELETLEREKPVLVEITGMDIKANLVTLYEYRDRLKAMKGYSPTTMQVCTDRLGALEREIVQLEAFATGLIEAAQGLDNLPAVNNWQNQYLRQLNRYADTQYHHDLETAEERVRHVRVFLEELDQVTRRLPTNYHEANNVINKLDKMYDIRDDWLGPMHKQLVSDTRKRIVGYVQEQVIQARRWYSGLEDEFEKGGVANVIEKSKNPHPFFPDVDKPKLEDLQKRIQQRLDDDVITRIETQFRQINDKGKCDQCLTRLQHIMVEKYS